MKQINKILYFFTAAILLTTTSCKKYLDVNKNLNDPTKVSVSLLLTGAQRQIAYSINDLSTDLSIYTHQRNNRGGGDGYGLKGSDMNWNGFYDAIADLDVIIEQAPAELRFRYLGIAKILKAYTYSQMVDVWGALPFSEFNKFKQGITQPKFDEDEVIYPQLITMIDAGIADINNTAANASLPGADDLIYGGDKAKWIKAANTIKLKLYTQLRKFQNVTTQVTALLAAPSTLIATTSEGMYLPFGTTTNDRNPGFDDYSASQRGQNPSPWLYEIMKGIDHGPTNPSVFMGIEDPRLPYYIFNQLPVTGAPTPANMTEYRDGPFVSFYFGSRGPNRDGTQQNSYSMFGIYPVGGRYDDGAGGNATAAFGTGAAPQKLLTYADRLYLEAELINTGVITTGDAKAVFTAAMNASMAQVDYVITNFVKPSQNVPPLGTQTAYVNSILALYDAGNASKKLEYIITEKWLSSIWSSIDQYTDYRRTGFPIFFDPSNALHAPGGKVQPPVNGNPLLAAQPSVPVSVSVPYPESLPWPQSEKELNANAPTQKTPATYKIFWKP